MLGELTMFIDSILIVTVKVPVLVDLEHRCDSLSTDGVEYIPVFDGQKTIFVCQFCVLMVDPYEKSTLLVKTQFLLAKYHMFDD